MLDAIEAFFLDRRGQLAVFEQRRRGVAVECVKTKNQHVFRKIRSALSSMARRNTLFPSPCLLKDQRVHQEAEPESLQDMEYETLFAIEEAQPE